MNRVQRGQLDLNLLVMLGALLERRSVTGAARQLALTPSAVSHGLRRLREQLGDPLFVRTREGMVPTDRARQIGGPLARGLDEIGRAIDEPPGWEPREARRRFTIAASDYGAWLVLPGLMSLLATAAPGVDVALQAIPQDADRALEAGALDLVICLEAHLHPSLHRRRLADDRFVCVVRAGHPAARRPLTLARYLALRHAAVAPLGQRAGHVDGQLARLGHHRRIALCLPHFLVAPFVVARTDLVMTVSERLAGTLRAPLGLVVVRKAPVELPAFTTFLAWHQRQHVDPPQLWLREMVTRAVS